MVKDIRKEAKEKFKDYEKDLIDKAKHYLDILFDDYVEVAHENWKN